jgi:hypothetical protein
MPWPEAPPKRPSEQGPLNGCASATTIPAPRRIAAVVCLAAAAAAAAAVTAGTVLLAISGAQPDHGATIHTAGYDVNVPAGFTTRQPTAQASCVDYPIVYRPQPSSPEATPVTEPGMSAAASRLGGAISAEYSAPYKPTSKIPDPVDLSPGRHSVRVGRYHGSITPAPDIFVPGSAPRAAAAGDTILFVQFLSRAASTTTSSSALATCPSPN